MAGSDDKGRRAARQRRSEDGRLGQAPAGIVVLFGHRPKLVGRWVQV